MRVARLCFTSPINLSSPEYGIGPETALGEHQDVSLATHRAILECCVAA